MLLNKGGIKKEISHAFSTKEILNKVKTKVITYPELLDYDNIDDVLDKNGTLVILYLAKPKYGHWTCLVKRGDNVIEHFDAYENKQPDSELDWISKTFRKEYNEWFPYLTKLLYQSGYDVEYNNYPLQKHDPSVKTCGRWVVMRILFKHLSIDDFAKLFLSSKKYDSDELVTIASELINLK